MPAILGGIEIGFLNPSTEADREYKNLTFATAKLTEAIYQQDVQFKFDEEAHKEIIKELSKKKKNGGKITKKDYMKI